MPSAAHITVTLDKPDMLKQIAKGHRKLDNLLTPIGVAAMSGMALRLASSYSTKAESYQTGLLLRSLRVDSEGRGHDGTIFERTPANISVGSNVRYAAIQDVGGTVTPKTVKALAIPIPRALKVSRKWPRSFPDDSLAFMPAKKGDPSTVGVLYNPDGSLGFGKGPLFVLRKSVTIEAKGLTAAGKQSVNDELDEIYEYWIEEIADGG